MRQGPDFESDAPGRSSQQPHATYCSHVPQLTGSDLSGETVQVKACELDQRPRFQLPGGGDGGQETIVEVQVKNAIASPHYGAVGQASVVSSIA